LKIDKHFFLKALISIFIIYHLVVIIVLPNGFSYLGRVLHPFIVPYANTLGLNTTWNFFSPDPANTIFFEYSVRFEDEMGNPIKEPIFGVLPKEKDQIITDSSQRRFLYAVRFLMLDKNRLELLFAPWLCRQYEGATRVSIKQVTQQIPNLDMANKMSDNETVVRNEIASEFSSYNCVKN
jgi:hypothetical protein